MAPFVPSLWSVVQAFKVELDVYIYSAALQNGALDAPRARRNNNHASTRKKTVSSAPIREIAVNHASSFENSPHATSTSERSTSERPMTTSDRLHHKLTVRMAIEVLMVIVLFAWTAMRASIIGLLILWDHLKRRVSYQTLMSSTFTYVWKNTC